MHNDTFGLILLELAFVTLLGVLGRAVARGAGQPAVLGELVIGILAVNLAALAGVSLTRIVTGLQTFSQLAVILLLFVAGLESRVSEILNLGRRVSAVAVAGALGPAVIGIIALQFLLPDAGLTIHLFVVAILLATSIAVNSRVFRDLGRRACPEAKIILGAAAIDNVLALILLTVVSAMASATDWDLTPVLKTLGLSLLFVTTAVGLGPFVIRRLIEAFEFLDPERFKLFFPLSLCLALAWLAGEIGLAAPIGAFVAGLIINDEDFEKRDRPHETLETLITPFEAFFAPVFFVLMGLQVNLAAFVYPEILILALGLTVVGILGKGLCALPAGRRRNRWAVGLGMIPRGEFGLVFIAAGKPLGIMEEALFPAAVLMVVLTTLIAPPALRWALARQR